MLCVKTQGGWELRICKAALYLPVQQLFLLSQLCIFPCVFTWSRVTVLVWVARRWEGYSQFLMWDINCKPHGQPHIWNKHTCSRDAHHGLKRIHVDLEGFWCEGICVLHLNSKPNQIWELPVPDGAPQAHDFKAQTWCELTPLIHISLETKTKHQSVMIWGRSGRVCAEPAIHWGILLHIRCRFTFWNRCETGMEAERTQLLGRCLPHRRLPGCCSLGESPGLTGPWTLANDSGLKSGFLLNMVKVVCETFLNRVCLSRVPLAESLCNHLS